MKYQLKSILPNIKQERNDWCIPACIEISLKYLQQSFDISQGDLWTLLNGKQPSFGIYKKILDNLSKFRVFNFEHWGPGNAKDLRGKIEKGLSNNFPVLISTPAIPPATGWHIRVCNAIENDELTMYDPGDGQDNIKERINDIIRTTEKQGGGDILVISLKDKT